MTRGFGLRSWALILLLPAIASAQPIAGTPTITDGDTIRIGDTRIRLLGIDAPEMSSRCGPHRPGTMARDALVEIIAGRAVACEPQYLDRYGRTVAVCAAGDVADLAAAMVAAGWAGDWPRYSGGAYADAEAEAAAAGRGTWAMCETEPWRE